MTHLRQLTIALRAKRPGLIFASRWPSFFPLARLRPWRQAEDHDRLGPGVPPGSCSMCSPAAWSASVTSVCSPTASAAPLLSAAGYCWVRPPVPIRR